MSEYSRRGFINTTGAGLLGLAGLPLAAAEESHDRPRPNILYIMADDHAAHAISAYGSRLTRTPNIDRIAEGGVRFTNCFNVNSLCAPSRAALITGCYSSRNGFMRNGDVFDTSQVTFPQLLQKAGYQTALVGKWHLRSQPQGFDYYSVIPGQGRYFNCPFRDSDRPWPETKKLEGYLTNVITDKAIGWMSGRDPARPFCLMVHHKAPHGPYRYPEKYAGLFTDRDLPKPDNFYADDADRGQALAGSRGRWSRLKDALPSHFNQKVPEGIEKGTRAYQDWAYQSMFKGYLRLVACLDENIGRLLDYLDQSGLSANTLVVYTADNGFFMGDFGLFNKMWMYEESLRLPLLVRYPREIKARTVSEDFISLLDFAPTFLDYAGAAAAPEFQGRSIRPVLEGHTPGDWRNAHYYHYYGQYDVPPHYGVRTAHYKLLHYYEMPGEEGWELYDLDKDPGENRNRYGEPGYADVVARLKTLLGRMRRRYEAPGELAREAAAK